MNLDQFRSRPLVVTVKDLCPCCNVLKEGVKMHTGWGSSVYSCEPCYEAEKLKWAAKIDEDYYAW
jgi:hypothetical protein